MHLLRKSPAQRRGLSRRRPDCGAAAAGLTLTPTPCPITRRSNQGFFSPPFKPNCVASKFDTTTLHSKAQNENVAVAPGTVLVSSCLVPASTPPDAVLRHVFNPFIISRDVHVTAQISISSAIIPLPMRINKYIVGTTAFNVYIY